MAEVQGKDPYMFVALQALTGFSGSDRLYLGCYVTGFIKLLLFAVFLAVTYTSPASLKDIAYKTEISYFLGYVVLVWYLLDTLLSLSKIALGSLEVMNCRRSLQPPASMELLSTLCAGLVAFIVVFAMTRDTF